MPRSLSFGDPPSTAIHYLAKKRKPGRGANAPSAALVLAHGAGAPQTHPFMVRIATGVAARGIDVLTFNFHYSEKGSKRPDAHAALEKCWFAAIELAKKKLKGRKIFIGGKSMGGRIASHIAASGAEVGGLICLGYPLAPASAPKRSRVAHFADIRVPTLFIQGTRDPFGGPKEIAAAAKPIVGATTIQSVPDGDHGFAVRKKAGVPQDAIFDGVLDGIARFIEAHASGDRL